jgi:4-amino-4-deoxy-L-arabinose transferase-like glycosyltransferase
MKPSTPKTLFLTLILLQLVFWTLIPTLTRLSLPIDAIEGYVWGQHFDWGYDRNPWVNALLTHWAVNLGGKSGWLVYGFSQIFVCLGYFSVWKLAQKIFRSDTYALVSVLMLVGVQYTSLAAVDFNDNVIELGLWPLFAYLSYEAFFSIKKSQELFYWILTGLIAGLALMTKYYSIMPIASLGLFLLSTPDARAKFKTLGPYLAGLLCFLICLPHLLWLPKHHFMTMAYALGKADQIARPLWATAHPILFFLWNHTYYALHFAWAQSLTFAGALALLWFAAFPRKPSAKALPEVSLSPLALKFLDFMVLGPFALTLLTSIIFGWKLNTMWGTPLLSLWPIWVLGLLKPKFTSQGIWRIALAALIVFVLLITGYAIHNIRNQGSRHNLNGQAISDKINHQIESNYHSRISVISGDRYLAGYIAFYADHPIRVKWD